MRINLIKFRKTRAVGKRTKKYFADVLGISRQHYSNIEDGLANPSFELLEKFYEIFNDEYDDLWEIFKKSN